MKYIQEHHDYDGCIFCLAAAEDQDEENLIFFRGEDVFLILNRYPYTSGHVMCVPYAHVDRLHAMSEAARAEMMEMTNKAVDVLQQVYTPEGFNVGLNLGAMAGAGLADHLHMHIVPRWGGDTNFMSSVGETRVLPESLDETYERVKTAWDSFSGD
ncbi:MAG: HIT domain-containing protein [Chloroflexota bacterium]|nr:HIT domain-containing protein [Chloroflexota bacterium]